MFSTKPTLITSSFGKPLKFNIRFFESRSEPSTDPLVLWLNGGPGCSSMTGLLMELGPCRVTPGGAGTEYNKFSWNEKANLLFLDQPVNAGFSWTDGDQVASTEDAAVDVYNFLQLFLNKHKKYSKQSFFITGESYAVSLIASNL
jgi:cathepsin A (carboxypeptidase C)